MTRVALIDADILVYRCAASLRKKEYRVHTADGELLASGTSKKAVMEGLEGMDDLIIESRDVFDEVRFAYRAVEKMIDDICFNTGCPTYKLFVTGNDNFRVGLATIAPYKGQRPERPRYYQEVKDYVWSLPGIVVAEGCEADDTIGVHSYGDPNVVICSIDKDLDMLPGAHYNFVSKEEYYINEEDGMVNFYRQILTGDKIDNIMGIRGLGPVTAAKLIRVGMTEWEMYCTCLEQYEKMYANSGSKNATTEAEKHVNENGKLLWLWRKKGDIWEPPTPVVDLANDTRTTNESTTDQS